MIRYARRLSPEQRALRDARRASRPDRFDRRIPLLDRDFDQFAMGA